MLHASCLMSRRSVLTAARDAARGAAVAHQGGASARTGPGVANPIYCSAPAPASEPSHTTPHLKSQDSDADAQLSHLRELAGNNGRKSLVFRPQCIRRGCRFSCLRTAAPDLPARLGDYPPRKDHAGVSAPARLRFVLHLCLGTLTCPRTDTLVHPFHYVHLPVYV